MLLSHLWKVVAEGITNDPVTYNEGILGYFSPVPCHIHLSQRTLRQSPQKYVSTILKPQTWGGAIELALLATHFQTEIASVDVETGRVDRFTPTGTASTGMRYGLHYYFEMGTKTWDTADVF